MILVPQDKIDACTASGWWGTQTLDGVFRGNVALHGSRTAVADAFNRASFTDGAPRSLSYAQLDGEVMRLAGVLLAGGLGKDDVVALQMPNCVEQFVVYLACARLGIIVSPVPIQYREHELSHVLSITGARAAITCRRIGRHAHAAMFEALRATQPSLQAVYAFGDTAADAAPGEPLPPGTVALAPLLAAADDLDSRSRVDSYVLRTPISANDVFTICWTSGTESAPKGVPRSHNEWLVLAPTVIEGAGLRPHCRMLSPFPLVNMAGLSAGFAAWLVLAGTVVQHQPFDLAVFLQQLREEAIDYTIAAPAILGQLLHNEALAEGIDFKRLATIGSGSAPLSQWLVQGFKERFGVDIVNHFGSNEGASLTGGPRDVPDPGTRARFFPRAGVAGFDWHVSTTRKISTRLVDLETGEDIHEPGRVGELRYAGATVFSGYWNAPELTARAFDAQGYYKTGDLFEIGGERGQYYRYAGRSKDMVIRGGMNISSEEVENLILAHPAVREAAIVGYADEAMGERVCACVVLKAGETLTLDGLKAFLRDVQRIAVYKLPERLVLLDALPRNPVGKILKRVLREQLAPAPEPVHGT
ncbi:MAG: class I adenylate-forming enzyme family protein [Pseudomonadota bacterium]